MERTTASSAANRFKRLRSPQTVHPPFLIHFAAKRFAQYRIRHYCLFATSSYRRQLALASELLAISSNLPMDDPRCLPCRSQPAHYVHACGGLMILTKCSSAVQRHGILRRSAIVIKGRNTS